MKSKTLIGASFIALALFAGCVETMPGAVVAVGAPPPPLVEVAPPLPYAGAIWAPGHWRWSGRRYSWIRGRYIRPRPGRAWVPARCWQGPRGRWHCSRGHWR